jgi:hypothetical protein
VKVIDRRGVGIRLFFGGIAILAAGGPEKGAGSAWDSPLTAVDSNMALLKTDANCIIPVKKCITCLSY